MRSIGLGSVSMFSVVALFLLAGCSRNEGPPKAAEETSPAVSIPADSTLVSLGNLMGGWRATGVTINAGDAVGLFGVGEFNVEGLLFEVRHLLWYRIGADGPANNFSANQETFVADAPGEIFVALRPPGVYWSDRRGSFPPGFSQAPAVPVDFSVNVVGLGQATHEGLQTLAARGDSDAVEALRVLDAQKTLPAGYEHLWYLSRANVWQSDRVNGKGAISAAVLGDYSIVKKELDIPLTSSTELLYQARYDALPAAGPETEAAFHDYLSVAIEFDNGQDLTWMRSVSLPIDSHFRCPLPWWDTRETHFVVASGEEGLGEWTSHRRNILTDYKTAVPGDAPSRIVGVWFIGVSIAGGKPAAATFADVAIVDGASRVELL